MERHRLTLAAPAAPLVLVVAALGLAQTAMGERLLAGAGLARAPEHSTALSLERPAAPPARLHDGQALRVGFSIANREGGDRTYAWKLAAGPSVGRGKLRVGSGRTSRGTAKVARVRCGAQRTRVRLTTSPPRRAVAFWATCRRSGGARGR